MKPGLWFLGSGIILTFFWLYTTGDKQVKIHFKNKISTEIVRLSAGYRGLEISADNQTSR